MDTREIEKLDEIKRIVEDLAKAGVTIREVYLFGSALQSADYNDIDLALVSDQFSGIRFYDLKNILDTTNNYSSDIDLHPFRTSDFYDEDNFFAKEIIEHGRLLTIN
ncbi:MAG: hypothetical protein U5K00_23785 [Melioribacteraceae bacterium]|nr:hypothetical protein [Melioribacteraceae bacterium]